jgi:hypothetical protein
MNPYLPHPLPPPVLRDCREAYYEIAKASIERAEDVLGKAQFSLMTACTAIDLKDPPTAKKAELALLAAESWDRASSATYATALAWQALSFKAKMDWDATAEARAARRTDKLCEDLCAAAPWRAKKRPRHD